MDKITHEVRCKQWTSIINECLASGMTKTAWCRANGISDKQFFYWQRILRKEAYIEMGSSSKDLPSVPGPDTTLAEVQKSSFVEVKVLVGESSCIFRPRNPHLTAYLTTLHGQTDHSSRSFRPLFTYR